MSGKLFKGDISNSVVELNLLDGDAGSLSYGIGGTNNGEIKVVHKGDITQSSGFYDAGSSQAGGDMKGLVIGTSCTSIGSNAFYYCDGLTGSLTIPDSVTSIGSYAFAYWGISTPIGTLTIGNSVASIGSYAFSYSYFTGDLIIPDSVTTIGDSAFADWNFTNVLFNGNIVIGSGVTSIGSSAFYGVGTTALYINCPASSWIGTNALIQTSPLTDIYVHADYVAGYDATWKSNQQTSATVSTWTNYPNIP